MKKYNSYKNTEDQWIKVVPNNWSLIRLKNIVKSPLKYGANEAAEDDNPNNPRYIRITDFGNDGNLRTDTFKSLEPSVAEPFLLEEGDLLFARSGATVGKTFLFKGYKGVACYAGYLIKASFDKQMINSQYVKYVTQSSYYENWKESVFQQATIQNIGADKYNLLKIPIPIKIEEQTQIANYLDHKTSKIDDLISKKEQLIELLKEERTAIINQAVTKGLDPNVPMKDSGIEWLGEIPEHWEVWKISHAFTKIGSGTTPESGNPLYHESGTINWLNTGDLNDSILFECSKKITPKALEDYTSLKLFPAGSLVIAMYGATIGKTALLEFETTTNQACCVFGRGDIIDLQFLQYWFKAKKEHIINLSVGGGQPNISQQILKDIRLGAPSIEEQMNIVEELRIKETELNKIKSAYLKEIELLKEYKTALISEVVTGKVDVRNEKIG